MGVLSHSTTRGPLQEKLSVTGPNMKMYLHVLPGETDSPATQPERNQGHPELTLFSSALSFEMTPLKFLLCPCKVTYLSFNCGACLWFSYSLIFLNCIFYCFRISPLSAGKMTDCYSFEVNTVWGPVWGSGGLLESLRLMSKQVQCPCSERLGEGSFGADSPVIISRIAIQKQHPHAL